MKIGPIPVRIYQNQLTHEAFALFTKLQELLQGWCLTSGDQVKFFPVFFWWVWRMWVASGGTSSCDIKFATEK